MTFWEPAAVDGSLAEELWKRSAGRERGEWFYERPDGDGRFGIGPILRDDLARTHVDDDVIDACVRQSGQEHEREQGRHGFSLYTTDSRNIVPASWMTIDPVSTRFRVRPRLARLAEK